MGFPRFLFMIALVGLTATVTSAQPATTAPGMESG